MFGLVQRDTGDFRLEICPGNKRDSRTLLALIEKHVEPGTTIFTDCWRAYNGLTELGFPHYTVNHTALCGSRHRYAHSDDRVTLACIEAASPGEG